MKNIKQLRLCMLGATVFSCGLAIPLTLPIWLFGEYLHMRGDDEKRPINTAHNSKKKS